MVEDLDPYVRIELRDTSGRYYGFVDSQVEQRRRDPIQVRELGTVEVGEPELAAKATHRQCVRHEMTDALADHANSLALEFLLVGESNSIAISIQPKSAK